MRQITEHLLIQQNFAQEADLYHEGLQEGTITQTVFVQNQRVNQDFRETLNPWHPEFSRRGQQEGVHGILQE